MTDFQRLCLSEMAHRQELLDDGLREQSRSCRILAASGLCRESPQGVFWITESGRAAIA